MGIWCRGGTCGVQNATLWCQFSSSFSWVPGLNLGLLAFIATALTCWGHLTDPLHFLLSLLTLSYPRKFNNMWAIHICTLHFISMGSIFENEERVTLDTEELLLLQFLRRQLRCIGKEMIVSIRARQTIECYGNMKLRYARDMEVRK